MRKCNNCGNIYKDSTTCPNCQSSDTKKYHENLDWYNRYASEKMAKQEAVEFFETDRY